MIDEILEQLNYKADRHRKLFSICNEKGFEAEAVLQKHLWRAYEEAHQIVRSNKPDTARNADKQQ